MKNSLFVVVSILLVLITATSDFAGSKKKKASLASAYHPPVISAVKANAITVTGEKTTRTFTVSRFTEINVNGQRATLADLKPGMTASVTIGMDPSTASRINATGAPQEGKKVRSD